MARLLIHVRPGAARPGVGGAYGDALVVRVPERAVEGAATEAALRAVAAAAGVRRAEVALVAGATSRAKVIEVPESVADLLERLRKG